MHDESLPVFHWPRGKLLLILKIVLVATALFITLRQLYPGHIGGFDPHSTPLHPARESPGDSEIPHKIWQTWHTPAALLADEDKERVRTWHEKNPHYRHELLTDQGAESYIRQHFVEDPLIRDVFLNLTDPILRADFLRYLILLADGGVYIDLDVECREPIDTWTPIPFLGKANVVLGVEADRKPVENDAKLYHDHREYIWGITNWAFMSKQGHPFMRFVAETVAHNILEVAEKQKRNVSTIDLSYKEVIDVTGPRAFTEAFFAYISKLLGRAITYRDVTMLEEPKLVGDILLLPIRAFSTAEASRDGIEGAHSYAWPTVLYHWSVGTWKKTHFQKSEHE